MKVTISGTPGSGKSSVGKAVAEKLNLKYFSIGDFRGKMALEKGITIDELNKKGETDFLSDKLADEYQKQLGEKQDNFIIDSRLGFHFIPDSIKIFIKCSLKEAAKRIFNDPRADEKNYANEAELETALAERIESDKKRYEQYYNLNPLDETNYDIVIDTTSISQEEAIAELTEKIQ